MSNEAVSLVIRAAAFAAHKHREQRRKDVDATPYINHPLSLARVLVEEGDVHDPVVLAAAILHDTIEDTRTTEEELIEQFGKEVAAIVAEVTDNKNLSGATRKELQVEHAPTLSARAKLVKLADKISNVRDIGGPNGPVDWPSARKREYFAWAVRVVTAMGSVHPVLEAKFAEAVARGEAVVN